MDYISLNEIRDSNYYKSLQVAKKHLINGNVIVIPTDTIYCFCCLIGNKRAIETISKLKKKKSNHTNYSILLADIKSINDYVKPYSRAIFKVLNKNLPGPFTFIFTANNFVPKMFNSNRKEIGIRVVNKDFCKDLLDLIDSPLVVSSVTKEDPINKHYNDPALINADFRNNLSLIIDDGIAGIEPSTIVDLREDEIVVLREGLGVLDL